MISIGDTLVADHGVWNDPPATEAGYAYQWYTTDKLGQNLAIIPGATTNRVTVQPGNAQQRFTVSVIATNAVGPSVPVFSALTDEVASPFGGGTTLEPWQYGLGMPAWLRVDGIEIANWGRTFEYLKAGLGGPDAILQATDACQILYTIDGGTPLVYATPADDPAPWYDPTRAESVQFLGVMVNSVQITPGETRTATAMPGRVGGSTLSPVVSPGMQINVQATIISTSKSGAEYGEEWLRGVLIDPACDPCGSSTVELRTSCPPSDGTNDDLGYWISYAVGVTSGPTLGAQDAMATTTDISWTWTSQEPYLYKAPTTGVPAQILDPTDTGGPCIDFESWLCGTGHSLPCVTVTPPNRGAWGTILTVFSPDGVGEILVSTYSSCPPNIGVDVPDAQMLITGLVGTLVVDSSQHLITYISLDGSEVRDGTDHVYIPEGQPLSWIEVEDCDQQKCVCVSTPTPCSGGGNTTVQLDLQYRRR